MVPFYQAAKNFYCVCLSIPIWRSSDIFHIYFFVYFLKCTTKHLLFHTIGCGVFARFIVRTEHLSPVLVFCTSRVYLWRAQLLCIENKFGGIMFVVRESVVQTILTFSLTKSGSCSPQPKTPAWKTNGEHITSSKFISQSPPGWHLH